MEWENIQQVVIALIGGGGATGLGYKLWQIVKEHKQGRLDLEDTAISRWQQIADKAEADAEKDLDAAYKEIARLRKELAWYRLHYGRLWAAYAVGPPPRYDDFPSTYVDE